MAGLISRQCLKNGLVVYPGSGEVDGHRGDHILIAPPFIITKNQINEMAAILDQSIQEVIQNVL